MQNVALIKSLLNFMRRAIVDMHLGSRNILWCYKLKTPIFLAVIMKQPTIDALLYVFENAKHFGPSLFHPCYHLIISFISQETNQINMIHETGLTQSILTCLMANDVRLISELQLGVKMSRTL